MEKEQYPKGRIGDISCLGICHPTEDPEKVVTAIRNLLGPDARFELVVAESHFGLPMKLVTGRTEGNAAFTHILSRLTGKDIDQLLNQLDQRMDDSNRLHMRFDKQSAFTDAPVLYSSADPASRKQRDSVDIEIRLITYPGKRETAIGFISRLIDEVRNKQG